MEPSHRMPNFYLVYPPHQDWECSWGALDVDTYNNTNHMRKIIYFGGKVLETIYIDGIKKFNYKSLSKLSFSGRERYIIIKKSSSNDIGTNIRNIMVGRKTIDNKLEEILIKCFLFPTPVFNN